MKAILAQNDDDSDDGRFEGTRQLGDRVNAALRLGPPALLDRV